MAIKPPPRPPQRQPPRPIRQPRPPPVIVQKDLPRKNLPLYWLAAGTLFSCALVYTGTSFYLQASKPCKHANLEHVDLNSVYEETAGDFDAKTDSAEFWFGIGRLRRKLVEQAQGDVLESAAGTGRNLLYYDTDRVKSLVLVDKSESMLEVCKKKWQENQMIGKGWRYKVGFGAADLTGENVETVAGQKQFDTVIQTFAVCSTDEPERLLRNLGKLVKKDGRILLLEHGKGHYNWLNNTLDNSALNHAKQFGCWWNRDIGAIVEKSGLEVVDAKRYSLGTTWWYELRPKAIEDAPKILNDKGKNSAAPSPGVVTSTVAPKQWWEFWR